MTLRADLLGIRRAVHWWWYCDGQHATNHGYRGRLDREVSIRVSHPKRPYARSRAYNAELTHVVRDEILATKWGLTERCTRYLCGAYSWQANLYWHAERICARCALIRSGAREANA